MKPGDIAWAITTVVSGYGTDDPELCEPRRVEILGSPRGGKWARVRDGERQGWALRGQLYPAEASAWRANAMAMRREAQKLNLEACAMVEKANEAVRRAAEIGAAGNGKGGEDAR